MSHSPLQESGSKRYSDGWRAVNVLIREGSSWSGRERNVVYRNLDGAAFRDESFVTGLDFDGDGRALAAADFDRDGDLDLALKFRTGPQLRLMENRAEQPRSLVVELRGGEGSNRDAIGARAELVTNRRRIARHVFGNSGFFSQSSRKLHFGLAPGETPKHLEIRWPSGAAETIPAPPVGESVVVQGSARATPAARRAPRRAASSEAPAPPEATGVWLVEPLPAPDFDLEGTAGRRRLSEGLGRRTLLNFWATWCPPCRQELADLARERDSLSAAGVDVVLVSVDAPEDRDKVGAFLAETALPFPSLHADDATVTAYTVLHRHLTNERRDMAIPTSFLLDERGRVLKMYRGTVEPASIVADSALSEAEAGARAFPFDGRRIGPRPSRSLLAMATEMASRGQTAAARRLFETAMERGERGSDLLNNFAGLLRSEGDIERAAELLRAALQANPGDVDARINLGGVLLETGDTTGGLALLLAARRARPDDPLIHNQLGAGYFLLNQLGNAESAYREAARLDPESGGAFAGLGSVLGAQGRLPEALEAFERARELGESDARLFANLGVLYMEFGRPAEGLAAFRAAAEADPNDYGGRLNLALYYLQEENSGEARKWLAEARAIDPTRPEAPYLEAQLLAAEGRIDEARALLEAALAATPDFEPARELLRDLGP